MLDGVFIENYAAPPVDEREILRYAGNKADADESLKKLLDECLRECLPVLSYRVCYAVGKARELEETFGGEYKGTLLTRRLCGAEYAAAFAATVGLGIDRLILRYTEVAPTKALLLQAIGAERIEALCDAFCKDMQTEWATKGFKVGARFSAGYGDFPLTAQRKIFALLSPERRIGLTLNGSLLMTPTKSVTAIVPIGGNATLSGGCAECELKECEMRGGVRGQGT
ncbi:MAG: hypothetical protein IJX91_04970 [Clostridia bacterium]|nr:hypothetical protein [Clostridia bacterium]